MLASSIRPHLSTKRPTMRRTAAVAAGKAAASARSPLPALAFDDHRAVFGHKSTWELVRALAILKTCSNNYFVDNNLKLMRRSRQLLGPWLFSRAVRPTFYGQFVGGDTAAELRSTAESLRRASADIGLMVCPVQEEDVGEQKEDGGSKYDSNLDYILSTARALAAIPLAQAAFPHNLQFKATAFMPAELVAQMTDLVRGGGGGKKMQDLVSVLAETMEGGHDRDTSSAWRDIRGLGPAENAELRRGVRRLRSLGLAASEAGLVLLCDAEYTYLNPGISALTLAMMVAFNKEKPLVGNTYQCYLKGALDNIREESELVLSGFGRCFGAKIVRGAYMEKERRLARDGGYEDPVNDDYESTGRMYDAVVDWATEAVATSRQSVRVVVATHNEDGVRHAVARMRERDIDPMGGSVVFAQIYGMAEQISVPLAKGGFAVYKSVPFGPLEEALPYLSRRAAENRVVLAGARKESQLLAAELRRRAIRRT